MNHVVIGGGADRAENSRRRNTLPISVPTIHGSPRPAPEARVQAGSPETHCAHSSRRATRRLNPYRGSNAVAAICTGVSRKTNEYASPTWNGRRPKPFREQHHGRANADLPRQRIEECEDETRAKRRQLRIRLGGGKAEPA